MKIIKAVLLLAAVTLAGNLISQLIGKVLPGSVIGMVLLFILLITKAVKIDFIQDTSLYLIAHLPLFILPGAISVMTTTGLTLNDILLLTFVAAVSTLITLTVTALVTEFLLKVTGETENDSNN